MELNAEELESIRPYLSLVDAEADEPSETDETTSAIITELPDGHGAIVSFRTSDIPSELLEHPKQTILIRHLPYWHLLSKVVKDAARVSSWFFAVRTLSAVDVFVGGAFVAQLGTNELAASSLIFSLQWTLQYCSTGILYPIKIIGGKKYPEEPHIMGSLMRQGYFTALLASIPQIIIMLFSKDILSLFMKSPDILEGVQGYFDIYVFAVLGVMLNTADRLFGFVTNREKSVFLTTLSGLCISLGLAHILINGEFSFPKLGIRGLALAYTAEAWWDFIIYKIYLMWNINTPSISSMALLDFQHADGKIRRSMWSLGAFVSMQISSEVLFLLIMSLLAMGMDTTQLSAQQVGVHYVYLIGIAFFSLSQATTLLISKTPSLARYYTYTTLAGIEVLASALTALAFTSPRLLLSPFIDVNDRQNNELVNSSTLVLQFLSASQIPDGVRQILSSGKRGLGDTMTPFIYSALSLWLIGLPLALGLDFGLDLPAWGLDLALLVSVTVAAVAMLHSWEHKSFLFFGCDCKGRGTSENPSINDATATLPT